MPFSAEEQKRFWSKVEKTDGCWIWRACLNNMGYGQVRARGIAHLAHRVSWELANGSIPDGLLVLHRCDNPPCVNPKHLSLGTARDNSDDRETKGRGRPPRGERCARAVLTIEKVRAIRARAAEDRGVLAAEFGVGRRTINQIIARVRWAHV